ncbi:MAG: hypothetical protein LBC61_06930 [Candidatus Peribacteria bacterium]|nr:hypothetical protein [Candidatus Peribacteria bacterium]
MLTIPSTSNSSLLPAPSIIHLPASSIIHVLFTTVLVCFSVTDITSGAFVFTSLNVADCFSKFTFINGIGK